MSATFDSTGRMRRPPASSTAISKTMRATKSRDTGPEVALRKALWAAGHRGYRTNYKNLPGKPDIVYTKKRVALLIHGCFWHGCSKCSNFRPPKANANFWASKLSETRLRDNAAEIALAQLGYTVLTIWECEVRRELQRVLRFVSSHLIADGAAQPRSESD